MLSLKGQIHWLDLHWVAVVHLYLVGFVMMSIVGALAQLLPVMIEKGHCCVQLYGVALGLMIMAVLLLFVGFWTAPILLSYGGLLLLIAFGLIGIDLIFSARARLLHHFSAASMGWMSLLVLIGSIVGFLMSLALGGIVDFAITSLIDTHIVLLFGAVMALVYGVTLVLLPMFALAHGFDTRSSRAALMLLLLGVLLYSFGVALLALALLALSILVHLYQISLIVRHRIRKERDIWFRSMVVAYGALAFSLLGLFFGWINDHESLVLASATLFAVGFLGFLISGHLYKIIPFLVWFERFSPLVGKQKVPMLHDMVPLRTADAQWSFSSIGTLALVLGIALDVQALFFAGCSALFVGAIFLAFNLLWMLRFR